MITEKIGDKSVYIFESHQAALIPWAEFRRKTGKTNLITLDTHTDTVLAFRNFICSEINGLPDDPHSLSEALCGKIDFRYSGTVEEAARRLVNDEQIDAAIKADILNCAFVISYHGTDTPSIEEENYLSHFNCEIVETGDGTSEMIFTRPEHDFNVPDEEQNFRMPVDRIFIVSPNAGFKYKQVEISEEEKRKHADIAIEAHYLKSKLAVIERMNMSLEEGSVFDSGYILDIDLDYFRTKKSISPEKPAEFYKLIRNAEIITVALEPEYVQSEKLQGEDITSEFLLEKLLNHISSALV
ncbi:UPF0489 family protein [Planktothrix sp. FACHB-1355]|nr:UPF0489 family protein [Planktothrix sp. FACHB-1355]